MLILLSCLLLCLLFGGFVWAAENKPPMRRFRRNYPGLCFFAVLGAVYFLVSLFEGSAIFLIFIALPIMCEFPAEVYVGRLHSIGAASMPAVPYICCVAPNLFTACAECMLYSQDVVGRIFQGVDFGETCKQRELDFI